MTGSRCVFLTFVKLTLSISRLLAACNLTYKCLNAPSPINFSFLKIDLTYLNRLSQMQRFTLLLTCLLLTIFSADAQELRGLCGNTYEDQMSQIDRYRANMKVAQLQPSKSRNAITYIPIQFIIVTRNNGSGGAKITDVLEQQCLLNEQYGAFDIIFYQADEPMVLANDVIYTDHTKTSGNFTMRQRRNPQAMNVWIVDDATPQSGGPAIGITLGYYDTVNDWIVIRRNQINGTNNTLAHEVGHFFSLFHPHLGWDAEPYDVNVHGATVSATAPNGSNTELMDGSNCDNAGDMICDTPPDYNFALSWTNCNYTADVKDPNGVKVDPDESLIMSYFRDMCTSKFSPTQVEMMIADVNSNQRNFLTRNDYTPVAEEITGETTLISPIESEVTASFNKVELKWTAVDGAESYYVEVDRSSSFTQDNFKYVVKTNSLILEDVLDADRNYRWRVTPYNASYTCVPTSSIERFRTNISTSVPSIGTVNDWTVQPNPVSENADLAITVNAKNAFIATVKFYNLTGQLLTTQADVRFEQGQSTTQIDKGQLSKGVYFIALENEEGILNKKIIVQ